MVDVEDVSGGGVEWAGECRSRLFDLIRGKRNIIYGRCDEVTCVSGLKHITITQQR